MQVNRDIPELLPSGVRQAIRLFIEECRSHIKAGQQSTKRQLEQINALPAKERQILEPGVRKQLDHFNRCESVIDYMLTKSDQKQRWPHRLKMMDENEIAEMGIDPDLWRVMKWELPDALSMLSNELAELPSIVESSH